MELEGIVVGCDAYQEDLLIGWWDSYSLFNDYPVAFADFGMSKNALAWCQERGNLFSAPDVPLHMDKIKPETAKIWQTHYGEGLWDARKVWFRKSQVLLNSPFLFSIWLDLDCEVQKNLKPLFTYLHEGFELGLMRENKGVQKKQRENGFIGVNETMYNAGVIIFRKDADILKTWADEISARNNLYISDQQALAKVLAADRGRFQELAPIYNWSMQNGANLDAFIYHYHGSHLKKMLPRSKIPPPSTWLLKLF